MAVKSLSKQLYALIARYFAGESTPADMEQLEKLLKDPELKKEYEFFRELLQKSQPANESDPPLKQSFDRITKRLKDEGSL